MLFRSLLQDLRDGHWWSGAEVYLPALSELFSLSFPSPPLLYDRDRFWDEARAFLDMARQRYQSIPLEDRPYSEPSDLFSLPVIPEGPRLSALLSPGAFDLGSRSNAEFRVGGGDLGPLTRRLRERLEEGELQTIVSESAVRAERLEALFVNHGFRLVKGQGRRGHARLCVGDLPEGFSVPGSLFLTAAEIFGERLSEAAPSTASAR